MRAAENLVVAETFLKFSNANNNNNNNNNNNYYYVSNSLCNRRTFSYKYF